MSATAPLVVRCPRCRRDVFEVRKDDQLGVLVGSPRLDAVHLNDAQITACIITGLPLWQIERRAGRLYTSLRTRWWPTEPVPGFIVPEHACARIWDAPTITLAPPPAPMFASPPF